MSNYLSIQAAEELLGLIRDSYFGGLAEWSETASRLSALSALCEPSSPVARFVVRVLSMHYSPLEDDWVEDDGHEEILPSRSREGTTTEYVRPNWAREDDPPILQLVPAASTGLADWGFHQADPDWFPSIPHGHWQGKDEPTLDPYTGRVYRGSNQIRRESRKKIIALWNDAKFRAFALAAINFYLQAFPYYRGWRVTNPRRLPRRR